MPDWALAMVCGQLGLGTSHGRLGTRSTQLAMGSPCSVEWLRSLQSTKKASTVLLCVCVCVCVCACARECACAGLKKSKPDVHKSLYTFVLGRLQTSGPLTPCSP